MDKIGTRDWVASLDLMIANKLHKWKKSNPIENGESIRMSWIFEQTDMTFFIFWEDGKEFVKLNLVAPRACHAYYWHGLNDKTFNRIMDRVGNLAMIVMCPPIDPLDAQLYGA